MSIGVIASRKVGGLSYYDSVMAEPDLTHYLRLGDTVGSSTAADSGPFSRAGVPLGGDGVSPILPVFGQTSLLATDPNTAVLFDQSVNNRITLPYNTYMEAPSFTVEFLIKTTWVPSIQSALVTRDLTSRNWMLYMSPAGRMTFTKYGNGISTLGQPSSGAGSTPLNDGAEHHVAMCYQSGPGAGTPSDGFAWMYVDGVLAASSIQDGRNPNLGLGNGAIGLGSVYAGTGNFWKPYALSGVFDEFAYYTGIVSGSNIAYRASLRA